LTTFQDIGGGPQLSSRPGALFFGATGKPAKTLYLHRFCAHLPKHKPTVNQFYKLDNCAWNMARLRAEHMKHFLRAVNLRVPELRGRDERVRDAQGQAG
jgi:hypothetical protein